MWVGTHLCAMVHSGSKRITCRNCWFFYVFIFLTMWVLGIELWLSGLEVITYTHWIICTFSKGRDYLSWRILSVYYGMEGHMSAIHPFTYQIFIYHSLYSKPWAITMNMYVRVCMLVCVKFVSKVLNLKVIIF